MPSDFDTDTDTITDFDTDILDENDLRARLQAGDESAFQLLLDAWSSSMFRIARSLVATAASAEEAVQDAWLGVVRGIAGFDGGTSLKTWVFRLLVDAAEDRRALERGDAPAGCPACDDSGSWDRRLREVVTDAVAGLPAHGRVVITLRDGKGYSAAEVCELLDLSPGDQRAILYRARAAVRAHVERYAIPRTDRTKPATARPIASALSSWT